ncbi:Sphingoid long-chain base transporter RSB1 [Candida viswanathii]|uniref:Sphingoid long-chain base transporter RSB1 n=1 Tax=Candida viswanathii TaxID=5486 RepID=A0A367YLR1_9ASCO|nr:Sphingoid long-chain base transporter RSB1 [Candida viswanathii]
MSIDNHIPKRDDFNYFGESIKYAPNIVYLTVYALIFGNYTLMIIKSRYWWFNITFFIGYGMEFIGFLGRVLAVGRETDLSFYTMQSFCLTVAPAFIMGGIYFIFGQLVVVHGSEFSRLPPMWYSYFFITADVCTILIQGTGGGIASSNLTGNAGTVIMIIGVASQVAAMSIFLFFWFEFLVRVYFRYSNRETARSSLTERNVSNFMKLFLNLPSTRGYRKNYLDESYDPTYRNIRQNYLFGWFPLAITVAVIAIYIRCVYRVVELAQGWNGYLMVHEVYLLVLDALMVTICGLVFIPFHPYWVFGKENILKRRTVKNARKGKVIEKSDPDVAGNKETCQIQIE